MATQTGLGILTGKKDYIDSVPYPLLGNGSVSPGGIPLYKGGRIVGGIGVAGIAGVPDDSFAGTVAEYAALVGAAAPKLFQFPADLRVVVVDGIALPFVDNSVLTSVTSGQQLPGTRAVAAGTPLQSLGEFIALPAALDMNAAPPDVPIPQPRLPNKCSDSPGPVPEGYLVAVKSDPVGGLRRSYGG